jgi:hypothetical protein
VRALKAKLAWLVLGRRLGLDRRPASAIPWRFGQSADSVVGACALREQAFAAINIPYD